MATAYPTAIDVLVNPTAVDNLNTATKIHHDQHSNVNDAVEAIETELGISPKGAAASVGARIAAVEAALAAKVDDSQVGVATAGPITGVATLDGAGKLAQNIDSANISSGTIAVARIPNLSGAKILGTGGGGVAIPVDAVPSLPASQTTSGTFAAARIPTLDAAIIGTGTIAAARLPSTVTSNANATVVADIAARDAIPLINRTDGMLVWVRTPAALFAWRTDSSKWFMISYRFVLSGSPLTTVSNVYANATGFSFPAEAGLTYGIKCNLFVDNTGTSAADIRFGWSFPAGTLHSAMMGNDVNTASPSYNGSWTGHAIMGASSSPSDEGTGLGTPSAIPLAAMLDATYICTTSGTVQMRFAQVTTNAIASRILAGSRMEVEGF